MSGLVSSRIPWLVGGKRWEIVTGCDHAKGICAVRDRGMCWAQNIAKGVQHTCIDCPARGNGCIDCDLPKRMFKPSFHPELLQAPLRARKPYTIAVCLGGDLWCDGVDPDWRRQVFEVERQCPGHAFVHLTKQPKNIIGAELPKAMNVWMGVSITDGDRLSIMDSLWLHTWPDNSKWVSFEPIVGLVSGSQMYLAAMLRQDAIRYAVIGGLSDGNGQVVKPEDGGTQAEWVQPILDACHEAGVPMFVKNVGAIYRDLRNPRTGERFKSPTGLRDRVW